MNKPQPKTLEEKIAEAAQKLEQDKARLQQLKSQQTAAERKADAKRKILVGAVVLKKCEVNAEIKEEVWKWLDSSLYDNRDRAAFGLPLKEAKPANEAEAGKQSHAA